jgi:hypothetical protein
MKRILLALCVLAPIALGVLAAANSFNAPPTTLHVVVVKWKFHPTAAAGGHRRHS